MGRRDDACPGEENDSYRAAWDAYEPAYQTWQQQRLSAVQNAPGPLERPPANEEIQTAALVALGLLPEPPEPPDLRCTTGRPVWCPRCQSAIRSALPTIGDLASLLESWADGHRGPASGEKIPSRQSTAPSPSPIADTLDVLYGFLIEVEDDWREHAGHGPRPPRPRNSDAREKTLAYLRAQLTQILANPGSARFGREALAWLRRLRDLAKSDQVLRPRPGRCPNTRCRLVNVLRTRDDGHIECRSCGRLMNEDEYQEQVVHGMDARVVIESREAISRRRAG